MSRRVASALILLACCSGAPLFAQDVFDPRVVESLLPPVDRSASQAAREDLADARIALQRAQFAVDRNSGRIESALRNGATYREALFAAQAARRRYFDVTRPILDALKADEEYAKLHDQRETARQMIDRLVESQRAEFVALLPHAKDALEAGRQMTRAEVIALALDPEVEDARLAMVNAYAALRMMNGEIRTTAGNDESVRVARRELEEARKRVDDAQLAYVEALELEAAAERERAARLDALRRAASTPRIADDPGE